MAGNISRLALFFIPKNEVRASGDDISLVRIYWLTATLDQPGRFCAVRK
jgi:hypothetical protein